MKPASILLTLFASSLHAQTPEIQTALPGAIAPGKPIDITFGGDHLENATALWTSVDAICEPQTSDADHATFRVTLGDDVSVGVCAVRVATRKGISNPLLILIDDLRSVERSSDNVSRDAAQILPVPVAVDGECRDDVLDHYRFSVAAGQSLSFEVVAQRLGSPLDPVVRLASASGSELLLVDDSPGVGADCRFLHTFEDAGDYYLAIRAVDYRGGRGSRYRLRIGEFPVADVAFPLGGRRGGQTEFSFRGPRVEGVSPRTVEIPERVPGGRFYVGVPGSGGGSGFVEVLASDLESYIETDAPNDTPETATELAFPVAIDGRFERPRDRDHYRFGVSKGQRLIFAGRTRSLGSPAELFLRLLRADGSDVVTADASGSDEGRIDHTFKQAGPHVLLVEELNRRGGSDHVYRVEVREERPGFALSIETDRVSVKRGDTFELKVTCNRNAYDGPVELFLEDRGAEIDTAALEIDMGTIEKGKKEAKLRIKVPGALRPGEVLTLRIGGRAEVDGAELTRIATTASSAAPSKKKRPPPKRNLPPMLDGVIAVGIRE